ncbi:uncharacterized protein LOC125371090 [Ricinus communis]|uniref:uncharacterized protein LOC125371090 n=1 Tax=Ricinus communis TaxID=3988 RepID=UPI00201B27CE|nr:uncharacterized protein LOC125371090 [Ricinus communis]
MPPPFPPLPSFPPYVPSFQPAQTPSSSPSLADVTSFFFFLAADDKLEEGKLLPCCQRKNSRLPSLFCQSDIRIVLPTVDNPKPAPPRCLSSTDSLGRISPEQLPSHNNLAVSDGEISRIEWNSA